LFTGAAWTPVGGIGMPAVGRTLPDGALAELPVLPVPTAVTMTVYDVRLSSPVITQSLRLLAVVQKSPPGVAVAL
jgi:hypothetical protein